MWRARIVLLSAAEIGTMAIQRQQGQAQARPTDEEPNEPGAVIGETRGRHRLESDRDTLGTI